jgi:hypothetical protein
VKHCLHCNKDRDLSRFSRNSERIDGYCTECKDCYNNRIRGSRPRAYRGWLWRNTAVRGISADLSYEEWLDLMSAPACACCGVDIDSAVRERMVTIDRIDNSGSYNVANVRAICMRCNMLKNSNTLETLEMISAYMRKNLPGL